MATNFSDAGAQNQNPVNGGAGGDTAKTAGGIVIGALVLLILIRRGFGAGATISGSVKVR